MIAFTRMAARRSRAVSASDTLQSERPPGTSIGQWVSGISAAVAVFCAGYVAFVQTPGRELTTKIDGVSSALVDLKVTANSIRKDVDVLQNWTRKHDAAFPGGHPIPGPSATASSIASASPRGATSAFPEDVPTVRPHQCISRRTRAKVNCTQDMTCRPAGKVYAPDFRREVAAKAGISDPENMLVCEP